MTENETLPIEAAITVLNGKWKLLILWHLKGGVHRFGEVRKLIPRITQKMLAQDLRDLEADGLVQRKIYPVIPPKVEYTLTPHGETILPALDVLAQWGRTHLKRGPAVGKSKRPGKAKKSEDQLLLDEGLQG
ncbi:MAG: helix-turn-helix transcriptional regulator [Candidatus Hydrogenedentes bacterium]|nr:helix-turn-helix transcriptional regulator [Candidatus Hydrogenedentota bacterium]